MNAYVCASRHDLADLMLWIFIDLLLIFIWFWEPFRNSLANVKANAKLVKCEIQHKNAKSNVKIGASFVYANKKNCSGVPGFCGSVVLGFWVSMFCSSVALGGGLAKRRKYYFEM